MGVKHAQQLPAVAVQLQHGGHLRFRFRPKALWAALCVGQCQHVPHLPAIAGKQAAALVGQFSRQPSLHLRHVSRRQLQTLVQNIIHTFCTPSITAGKDAAHYTPHMRQPASKTRQLSSAAQDYIKAVYSLEQEQQPVSTTALAARMGIAPASVTGMLKKLAEHKPRLVHYARHQGVTLTPGGRAIALEVLRHHRLIELYLSEALGYTGGEVHAEAEALEHVISEDFEERIALKLGDPRFDPHGDPIPTRAGQLQRGASTRLSELTSGLAGTVLAVQSPNPAEERYLAQLGLRAGAHVRVMERAPFNGPVHVLVNQERTAVLGREQAALIVMHLDSGASA